MRKLTRLATAAVMTLAVTGVALAGGGTGAYEFAVSFSNTNPAMQTGPDLGGGGVVYLWYTGCNTQIAQPGMSAAAMQAIPFDTWSVSGVVAMNGFLNAGSGSTILLAVGGCPVGPVVCAQMFISGTAGGVRLGDTPADEGSAVDCRANPAQWLWPDQTRFIGCATAGASVSNQDWGNGCTADAVEIQSWGGVKALYR